jgi:hypothetical protein
MKSGIAAHLPDEHFIVRVDGRVKSHHRRFLDALREGLQLRDQFPQHAVKVCAETSDELHLAMTGWNISTVSERVKALGGHYFCFSKYCETNASNSSRLLQAVACRTFCIRVQDCIWPFVSM